MGLKIGILVFGYNRPEMLERQIVFALGTELNVYVNLDGPRTDSAEANMRCAEVIERYKSEIKKYSISSINKGCNIAVTEAITWAYEHEQALIILEDDVFVDENFIDFATLMLNVHESNLAIGGISAMNIVPHKYLTNSVLDYRLSCYTSSWGWATWKNRWESHLEIANTFPNWSWDFPENFWTPLKRSIWRSFFSKTINGEYDAWDFRWQFSNWISHRLIVFPNRNLGLNLGFGPEATHTKAREIPTWLPNKIEKLSSSVERQKSGTYDLKADKWVAKNHYGATLNNFLRIVLATKFPFLKTMNIWAQSILNR